MFDEKPSSELQIRMAKVLVDIIGRERPLTSDDFLALDRTLDFTRYYPDDPNMGTQEGLIQDAMTRFVNILALVAAEGDQKAAAELMGSQEHYQELPELMGRIQKITKSEEPRRPQKSQAKILYEQWKKRGSPTTAKPPPKRG